MISTLHLPSNGRNPNETRSHAINDDCEQLFVEEIADLFRLSLQLTADARKARRCLIYARRDCFDGSTISSGPAHVWARRMVIRNAIHLVLCIDNDTSWVTELHLQPNEYRIEELRESVAILDLPDFDRLVLVICVLERISILDCALLLRRSPRDVRDAIVRATNRVPLSKNRTTPMMDARENFF